jgi:hypothetical protein
MFNLMLKYYKMKHLVIVCTSLLAIQSVFGQRYYNTPCVLASGFTNNPVKSVMALPVRQNMVPYDIETIHKRLNIDRKLIISGAVLTATGISTEAIGLGLFFIPRRQPVSTQPKTGGGGDFAILVLFTPQLTLIGAGVPLLTVGLTQRYKWRMKEKELKIQTGMLPGGNFGLAMKF